MTSLWLDVNQISDLTPLSGLTELTTLLLVENQITDASPLVGLVKLKYLNIRGNKLVDLEPLVALNRQNRHLELKIYHTRGDLPLPVTLSYFRAERTVEGVAIRWTTESEIDNAGFNILRSRTKDGTFKVVNPTLIEGAGTTGERHTYTWIDTTAKPDIVSTIIA